MKNKLISLGCSFGLIFSAFGNETIRNTNKVHFDEINHPKEQQKDFFSLNDLFSNLNTKKQKETVNEKKDYFEVDFLQAFAEDDPWDK